MQENLKLVPCNRDYHVRYDFFFILLPFKQGLLLEKSGRKEDLVETLGFGQSRVIFALLNKIAAIHIELILIITLRVWLCEVFSVVY